MVPIRIINDKVFFFTYRIIQQFTDTVYTIIILGQAKYVHGLIPKVYVGWQQFKKHS